MISRQPSAFFKRFLAIDSTLRESADRPLGRQRHSVCRVGLRPSRRRWLRRHLYLGHRPCRRFSEAMPSDLSHHYRSEGIRAMSGFPARTAADIGPEYRRTSNGVQTFAPNCKVDHTRKFQPTIERIAERLPRLLEAVTHFAIGGMHALAEANNASANLLMEQMSDESLFDSADLSIRDFRP
jgi:hypothetical protein